MTNMTSTARQPKGRPAGGQFSTIENSDSDAFLLTPPGSMAEILDAARAEAAALGPHVTGTMSLTTVDGTASAEHTVCVDHWSENWASLTAAGGAALDDDMPAEPRWVSSTANEETRCNICGAGVGEDPLVRNLRVYDALPDGIVGYTLSAEQYTPERMLAEYYSVEVSDAESFLDSLALTRGINRRDEYSFDSDDFPKPIYKIQLDPHDESVDLSWLDEPTDA